MRTPKPKTIQIVCTECGQDWEKHKKDAKGATDLGECVRLLKAALAAKPQTVWTCPAVTGGSAFNTTWTPTV